jgi:maltooligosyltrehalose trehalohydrolase
VLLRWWAPYAARVAVVAAGQPIEARPEEEAGWFQADDPRLAHGVDYTLLLDGHPVPDPLARWLPGGVHGPARVFDPTVFAWSDADWTGRPLDPDAVVYELHVGTFTRGGTLDAAAKQLPQLAALGVSHLELMPLAAFDGDRGWGYDGVAFNAVHTAYGGPEALCRFVDLAHESGLAVLLDVVHNHLGPSGNNWDRFGPFFNDALASPWGAAVNLDAAGSAAVRELLMGSAVGWLRDFHLDGLRLDAVHELRDGRARHYLAELAIAVDALAGQVGRPLSLIAESDRNDPRTVTSAALGGLGMTAQWDDDVHHALHWLLTGETGGYYADFGSLDAVAHALERAFLHDGRYSTFRGRQHGRPVDFGRTPPTRFVVALQTHDQVGNRAGGERLAQLVDTDRLAAGAALLLALPYVPMLFMGEEYGARTPWQFFTSFPDADLGAAVTQGRQREFGGHGWEGEIPDPQAPETFEASVLDWEEASRPDGAALLEWYRALISWRREVPATGPPTCRYAGDARGRPRWFAISAGRRSAVANLGDEPVLVAIESSVDPERDGAVDLVWPPASAAAPAGGRLVLPPGATALGRGLAVVAGPGPGSPLDEHEAGVVLEPALLVLEQGPHDPAHGLGSG